MPEDERSEFDFFEERPKAERSVAKFATAEPARRRVIVGWFYNIQGLRMAMGNVINSLLRDYPDAYTGKEAELDRTTFLKPIEKDEKFFADECRHVVEDLPIAQWLVKTVRGMGWNLAAQLTGLIGEINLFATISKLWAFAGLAPGQRRREGEKTDYSPALKRLMHNVATSFLKAGGFYAEAYAHFKAEEERKFRRFVGLLTERLRASGDPRASKVLERIETELKAAAKAKAERKIFRFGKFLTAIYEAAVVLGFKPPSVAKDRQYQLLVWAVEYLAKMFGLQSQPRAVPPAHLSTETPTPAITLITPALTPMHRHNRALRKVKKLFLQHLWLRWRELEGLPVTEPWIFSTAGGHDKAHYIPPPASKDDKFPVREAASLGEAEEVA